MIAKRFLHVFKFGVLTMLGGYAYASEPLKPSIQSHTLEADVFARALLQPVGNSSVSGTVEFQKRPNHVRALVSLANAKKDEDIAVRVIDAAKCPTEEEPLTASPKTNYELGAPRLKKGGVATTVKRLGKDSNDKTTLVNKIVVVGTSPYLACGVVEGTGQRAESPVKKQNSAE